MSTLFERPTHLRVVEKPQPAKARRLRLESLAVNCLVEPEDGRFWVSVRLSSGGEATLLVTEQTLRDLAAAAFEASR